MFRLVVMLVALSALCSALLVGGARSASEWHGGKLIAFTRADGVYVTRADGSGIRRISRPGLLANGVAWSPDGFKLAFVAAERDSGEGIGSKEAIWVTGANGSDPVRLVSVVAASRPTWSPDGRRIAFAAFRSGRRDIWVMRADGSNLRRLTTPRLVRFGVGSVDWSPSGGRIAFSTAGWIPDIYVMNANGGGLRNLTPGPRFVGAEPDWSPDGRRIVFTRNPGMGCGPQGCRSAEIYSMAASGRSLVRLTSTKVRVLDQSPDWSGDGSKLAFIRYDRKRGPSSSEIYVMNADGTGVARLTRNGVAEASPAWQPGY